MLTKAARLLTSPQGGSDLVGWGSGLAEWDPGFAEGPDLYHIFCDATFERTSLNNHRIHEGL